MSNIGINNKSNKIQIFEIGSGAPSGVTDAPDGGESGFERIFDAVKKRLSGQSGAAASGNDLPVGALCIVPISPAINVLTPGAAEISDDVIRTYARQQGLNPAVLGALLGHDLPGAVAGNAGQSLTVLAAPSSQSAQPALAGAAADLHDSFASSGWMDALDAMRTEKLQARTVDPGLVEGIRGLNPGLAAGRSAAQPNGAPDAGVGAATAADTMVDGVLRSFGKAPPLSSDVRARNGGANESGLAGNPADSTAGMPEAANGGKWLGMVAVVDAAGAATRFKPEQSLQQTVQISQTALPAAAVVAGQLAQSLKFERAAALLAQAPAATAKKADDRAETGIAEIQAPIGIVWHEEVNLTSFMPERGGQTGADTASAAISSGNASEPKGNEGVWRQERAQQDLQYQKLSEQMMEAIGRRITDQVAKGVWQMSFQLRPERLGKVDVSLGMAAGTIDAAFSSTQAETRQLLDSGLTRLKEVLQGSGFEVGNLQTDGQAAGNQGGRQPQSGGRESGLPKAGAMAPAVRSVESGAVEQSGRLVADGVDLIV